MSERPMRWWSRAALARAAEIFEAPWRDWCAGWGLLPDPPVAENACELALHERAFDWHLCGDDARVWLGFAGIASIEALELLLFLGSSRSPAAATSSALTHAVAAGAWRDLVETIEGAWTAGTAAVTHRTRPTAAVDPRELPAVTEWRPWSGAMVLQLHTVAEPTARLAILLSGKAAISRFGLETPSEASTWPALPALPATAAVIETQPVGLRIELDELTIDVGSLQSLRLGDVLPLRHRLDEPLHARVAGLHECERRELCRALLGKRDEQRGVELVSHDFN